MPGEDAALLRALRLSREWDVDRMASELRSAARTIGEPTAEHGALVRMIRTWEDGKHEPRERYRLLYKRVFAGEWPVNGAAPVPVQDPEALLERARRVPGREEIAALQLAAFRSGRMDLVAFGDKLLALQRQVDALTEELKRGLGEAGG